MTDRRRYHQLVFIWVRDPEMFADYLQNLPPIVARYGGAADLSLRPTTVQADQLALPDIVNLVHYDDKKAYQRFNADPEFQQIEPLRAGSVDLMTYEGYLRMADPSPTGPTTRAYTVEVATYRDGTGEAYRTYEERTEPLRSRFGYHIEYILDPQTAPAGRPGPDLVKISSFPDHAARSAFDADPTHTEVEQNLYPAAATHAIRLTCQAIGR
ncbi:DUF1330 domain-containing protein [Flindersiella endophytica]